MKNSMIKLAVGTAALLALSTSAHATLKTEKVTLKGNMVVNFNKLPAAVDTLGEAFTEGMFYGRLRTNFFYWDWSVEDFETGGKQKDNKNNGIGGSFIYKTAPLNGFSATVGMYTTQNAAFFKMDESDVKYSKSGKDTFSRNQIANGLGDGMTVLGQAYLQADFGKASVKVGRQMFETVFTKSNDTKMIPNTFDGVTATIKALPKTTIKLGYLAKQKLRDHTESHDVLAFNAADSWAENDDSAVNKSLTTDLIGNDNKLIVGSVTTKAIKNLKANISVAAVPGVLNNITLEAHYTIPVGGMKIVPGIRYMKQIDRLGATTNVASLKGATKTTGYKDPKSLNSGLLAARIDFKSGAFLGRLGYSKIDDAADIVAPWRGFPTGGFTRAMAQYNWYANTQTIMLRAGYDFGKAKILPGFSAMVRYAIQDFDDAKSSVSADSTVIHMDLRQNLGDSSELKFRLGVVTAEPGTTGKTDYSYNEYRVEYNYFF
ncbi:OprD family outer membrane porin [Sulfurimonas sp. SAG-AH-194-C20]|nr:OprD family outer membrane porin [Sulfurimonas sp. SAG-AH-194-C20]MDF1878875.1 OprD family outer membrane porin [Sulfurimonas sp. SAG-AH-194-C20]